MFSLPVLSAEAVDTQNFLLMHLNSKTNRPQFTTCDFTSQQNPADRTECNHKTDNPFTAKYLLCTELSKGMCYCAKGTSPNRGKSVENFPYGKTLKGSVKCIKVHSVTVFI